MIEQKRNKLNHLAGILPEGLLADSAWLERHGYARSLRSYYVANGWLQRPVRGLFRRPRGELGWEQVAISLQALMSCSVTVGGATALYLQGYAHYVPHTLKHIYLYSDDKLPSWLYHLDLEQQFIVRNRQRLFSVDNPLGDNWDLDVKTNHDAVLKGGFRVLHWGQWQWPLVVSTPERAYLELLDELPKHEEFHNADVLMEGMVDIDPFRMQELLEQTKSVKVKRLFFLYADRHNHAWWKHIKRDRIDLGQGKRSLVKHGKLHPQYKITVPDEFGGEEPNAIW
ncbi:MAG: type IV toxin-antitoxin system AbiEi family antitoxin domain-containing protein [Pseudohongiellaceae bacterium]